MCRGSSHGWLVYVEDKLTLIVLNPLSGNTVRLPRLTDAFVHECEDEVVEKVILSRDPACLGSFEVLAICCIYNRNKIVAHLKYGDESWSYSSENNFIKVAFYKDRIFGLSRESIVTSLAVDPSSKVIKITKDVAPRHSRKWLLKAVIKITKHIAPKRSRRGSRNCVLDPDFVESTNGDLLVVNRSLRPDNNIMFDDIYFEDDGITYEYHRNCDKSILEDSRSQSNRRNGSSPVLLTLPRAALPPTSPLRRKDGLVCKSSTFEGNFPGPTMNISQIVQNLDLQGLLRPRNGGLEQCSHHWVLALQGI
ncbi:hypothetical protein FNV43_RR02360 [Rhamnella rubrinervis]|uniref:KIB1-4 beta-propeller domain-containing protein n=1 Tax=Rhamnella rubrinervis TaxID=2594499 RepID=A0A8K0MT60_9ROSA|nr:hypothetical protein FNV43_RR02360 [Rhamnella rubrinervis]